MRISNFALLFVVFKRHLGRERVKASADISDTPELRSCVKVEVAVMGLPPSLIVLTVSVDVKLLWRRRRRRRRRKQHDTANRAASHATAKYQDFCFVGPCAKSKSTQHCFACDVASGSTCGKDRMRSKSCGVKRCCS